MFEIFGEDYNIVALDHCMSTHLLSILHFKPDGRYYVTIIDITHEAVLRGIFLNLQYSDMVLETLHDNKWGIKLRQQYNAAGLNDVWLKKPDEQGRLFSDIITLHLFRVNHLTGIVTIVARTIEIDSVEERWGDNCRILRYNLEGGLMAKTEASGKELKCASFINADCILLASEHRGAFEIVDPEGDRRNSFRLWEEHKRLWDTESSYETFEYVQS